MNGNHFFLNSRSILKGLFPIFLIMILFNCNQNLTESTTTTTTAGTTTTTTIYGKIDTIENFKSTNLNNVRNIRVYLPKSYDASDSQRYKVVYMHDGQNVFAPGGPYGCWFVEKAYADLQKKDLIEELIIVGVNNNSDRIKEYTPTLDAGYKDGGKGELYTKFIIEEVMPYVDKNYKTKTGPENTAIIGSSLGGLISMYIAWNHPEKFGMAGCVSSSFWWDNRNLLKEIEASSVKKNVKFWIDCGTAEGDDGATDIVDASNDGRAYMLEDARRAADKLNRLGWVEGIDLAYREGVNHGHNEGAWAKRIYDILYFFFKKSEPTLKSIKCRPFINELELTGKILTSYVSVDLSYDNYLITHLTYGKKTLSVENDAIATIDNDKYGKITPKSVGKTSIIATFGNFTDTADLNVCESISPNASIHFNVICPDAKSRDTIFIAGDGGPVPVGKEWTANGFASTRKISDTNYIFDFIMPKYKSFSFKLTRSGDWSSEEIISGNRTYTSSRDETVDITVSEWKG